jgi:hypothetical protein
METIREITATRTVTEQPPTNIFADIHKSIRHGLADVLARLGATDLEDAAQAASVEDDLLDLLAYCEDHVRHEEEHVRPALGDRIVPEVFDTGHPVHLQMIAELRSLVHALRGARPHHRATIGHSLYLHFSVFVADCLQHMAEEERVLLPLMHRALGESGLMAIHDGILRALTPAEQAQAARRMLPAIGPTARVELTRGMLKQAPPAAVAGLIESVRPALGQVAYDKLMGLVAPMSEVH